MREMYIELAGRQFCLRASFRVAERIYREVGDPLLIGKEVVLTDMLLQKGIPYEPRWELTIENVAKILHIAINTPDTVIDREELEELIFDNGLSDSSALAMDYLGNLLSPVASDVIADRRPVKDKKESDNAGK